MAEKKKTYRKEDMYPRLAPEDPVSGEVFFDQVLERHNIDLGDPVNQITMHFDSIVDLPFEGHVRCTGFRNGILHLACDNKSWEQLVRLNSSEIKKKIRGVFPEIELKKIFTSVPTT